MVVGQTHLLGLAGINGVVAGVLHLLDEVLMTLLGESATLLGVEVDVVGPHLKLVVEVLIEFGREVDVDADLVVLEGDEGEVQTGVAVEEENQGEVHGTILGGRGHLGVRRLLSLIEMKLGVQAPPLLVVLVDALATDGQLNVVDSALGDPVAIALGGGHGAGNLGRELDVHVTDKITVTGNGDGHAAGVGGGTVHGLFDVLHGEVRVALVLGLEEGNLGVTGKVDVLGAVSDELHETTGHLESCCTLY